MTDSDPASLQVTRNARRNRLLAKTPGANILDHPRVGLFKCAKHSTTNFGNHHGHSVFNSRNVSKVECTMGIAVLNFLSGRIEDLRRKIVDTDGGPVASF
jgi:hypothetical protein